MILSCWNKPGVFSCRSELSDIVFLTVHCLFKNCLPILGTSFTENYICFARPGKRPNITYTW